MGSVKVERIDHLGIDESVIQDLNIMDMIDSRITPDEREEITTRPTLRWIFQCMEGIHRVLLNIDGHNTCVIDGITELRKKIIQLFGQRVCLIYQLFSG